MISKAIEQFPKEDIFIILGYEEKFYKVSIVPTKNLKQTILWCLAAVVAAALPQYLAIIAWVIIVGSAVTACGRLARTAAALAGRTGPAMADTMAPPPPQDITRIGRSAPQDEAAPGAQS